MEKSKIDSDKNRTSSPDGDDLASKSFIKLAKLMEDYTASRTPSFSVPEKKGSKLKESFDKLGRSSKGNEKKLDQFNCILVASILFCNFFRFKSSR